MICPQRRGRTGPDKTRCSNLLALPAQALRYRIAVHVLTQKADLIREVVAVGRYGGGEHLELLMAIADREEDVGRIMMVGWMGELELKNPHLEEGFGVISQVMNTSGTGYFLRQLWVLRARPEELEKHLLVIQSQHRPFMRQMINQVRSVQLDNLTLVAQLQSSLAPEFARWTDSVDFSTERPHLYPGLELSSLGGLESIGEKRHALSNDMAYPVLYQWLIDPVATRYEFPEDVAVGLAGSLGTLGLMAKLFHLEGEVLSLESLVDPQSPHAASLRELDGIQFLRTKASDFAREQAIWAVDGLSLEETVEAIKASARGLIKVLQLERELMEIWLLEAQSES